MAKAGNEEEGYILYIYDSKHTPITREQCAFTCRFHSHDKLNIYRGDRGSETSGARGGCVGRVSCVDCRDYHDKVLES